MEAKKLSKERMKKYILRRKWQVKLTFLCTAMSTTKHMEIWDMEHEKTGGFNEFAQVNPTHSTSLLVSSWSSVMKPPV